MGHFGKNLEDKKIKKEEMEDARAEKAQHDCVSWLTDGREGPRLGYPLVHMGVGG